MKLAILGATKAHLQLYTKAKEMGIETYCIAWAKGAYCKDYADHFCDISIIDKEAIAQLCKKEKIDGIVSNALELAVPTAAYVSEKCGYNGLSYETALKSINKKEMRLCVQENNACPQPAFYLSSNGQAQHKHYPVIIKPTDSSCSNGVTKVNNDKEYSKAVERALNISESHEALIEEFIDGREISVETISNHGNHYVLTITDKETTGAPYFVELAHHQPSTLTVTLQKKVIQYVKNILNALGITNGASHAEFKIDKDGNVFLIEIGARGGGDFISYNLVELSTGYDFVKGMIEVALDIFKEPILTEQSYSGVYFLSKETAYLKDKIIENKGKAWVIDSNIEDKPFQTLKKSQDRVGFLIYKSDHKIRI